MYYFTSILKFKIMNEVLDKKIEDVLDSADRMFIATSVGGNSSGASVFYARDGEDLVFFTFNPTRKAEQIRLNPRVHVVTVSYTHLRAHETV